MPVAVQPVCPNCGLWEIQADDAYCGWCAQPVGQLSVRVDPGSYFRAGEISPITNLLIENPTCGTVKINAVRIVRGDWVKVAWDRPGLLPPCQTLKQELEINTLEMLADFREAEIYVANALGSEARIRLFAVRKPIQPRIEPATLAVWKDDPDAGRIALRVALNLGQIDVQQVTVSRPDLVTFEKEVCGAASKDAPLAFNILIDRERLFQEGRTGETIPLTFEISHEDVDGPTSTRAKVDALLAFPPFLHIVPDIKAPEFFRPGTAEFHLLIRNRKPLDPFAGKANGLLRVVAIELDHPDATLKAQWAAQFTKPLEISGGDTADACFRLDVNSFRGRTGSVNIVIRTACPAIIPDRRHQIDFAISDIKRFPGILALDFGSSNTCCSTLATGTMDPQPVKIDAQGTTSPTVVQYLSIEGEFANVRIGQEVKDAPLNNPRATISGLKQRLGMANEVVHIWPMQTGKLESRAVPDAVVDYLREIRKAAENANHCYFRDFVVTHPAVCSLRQYRNLNYAVQKAFSGEKAEIAFLQEPVASLLSLVRDQAMVSNLRPEYHAAAFDFGGGTTDVTIARIHQQHSGGKIEVTLELVSSWGRRWGGEDLTDFLMLQLLERSRNAHPDKFISIGETPESSDEDQRFNRGALRDWAEQWKIAATERRPFRKLLSLRAPGAGDTGFIEFQDIGPLLNDASSGATFEQAYFQELEQQIISMIGRLKQDLVKHDNLHLDFLQLSGKSSIIPKVQELFQKEFKDSGIEVVILPASQLKECVVSGACLWTQMTDHSGIIHLTTPTSLQATTSRLGTLDAAVRSFSEIIPLGYPLEEAKERKEYFWDPQRKTILVHESLSEADREVKDADLQVHQFTPEDASAIDKAQMLTLRLSVGKDYQPQLSALTASGAEVRFRLDAN